MEFFKLILVFIICIGLSLFVAYKMVLFFSDENEKTNTRRGRAKKFFYNNMEKNEEERKLHNDQFNWEVFKTKLQPHLLPASITIFMVVLLLNTMFPPPKIKETISDNPPKEKIQNNGIHTWIDATGKTHYTNTKIEQQGTSRETPIIVTNTNSILIPVIIGHKGQVIETTMLLDTGCGLTLLHHPIAQQLQPEFISQGTATIADGRQIESTQVRIDFLQVGPFLEKNFTASTSHVQNAVQLEYQGLLGMEFLKKHPFQIDTKRNLIRWM